MVNGGAAAAAAAVVAKLLVLVAIIAVIGGGAVANAGADAGVGGALPPDGRVYVDVLVAAL